MRKSCLFIAVFVLTAACYVTADEMFEEDIIKTTAGELEITFIGHASLMFTFGGKIIHVDPWSRMADYSKMPKADLVLVTHEHVDHLDPEALKIVLDEKSILIYTEKCSENYPGGIIMKNWDIKTMWGIRIEAVPSYVQDTSKIKNKRVIHPKGQNNGYVITFGDTRVYIASEIENMPELKMLENINIAFMAMDSIYNMTPESAAEAAKVFMPKILYPYHFFEVDPTEIVDLLKDTPEIEVRIRDMK